MSVARFILLISTLALAGCEIANVDNSAAPAKDDVPSLLASNDPRVCAHGDVKTTVLANALPEYQGFLTQGGNPLVFDTISASDTNPAIHEVSCNANLGSSTPGLNPKLSIAYMVRPSLDGDGSFIVSLAMAGVVKDYVQSHVSYWLGNANIAATPGSATSNDSHSDEGIGNGTEQSEEEAIPPEGRRFSDYAVDVQRLNFASPNFSGNSSEWATFRTRISQAAKSGVNFAGKYRLDYFGCGTSCVTPFTIDGESGAIIPVPLGGEETPYLSLDFKSESNLLKATWEVEGGSKCAFAEFVFFDNQYTEVSSKEVAGRCPI